ncbi:putative ADP-ribosylation factor-binding protein C25H2.16c [Leucoagaricus sp. SymC.cos]|nr:putative ADP-ribosylation factor-binding protein C25H2.16c [Leucoagaricus sp. SymC.cos]
MLQAGTSWMRTSPLEVLITRSCEPSLHEPNYALHLEVAEYINKKKANNPREAAMVIARLANHRNPHITLLALSLLDTLVQSCGYPFHLQISTKEFLNELVRRFPERPPPFPNPVMTRILDLIHGWKEGICNESRWKEDLGNIRDMHRLLTFKGYRFREIGRQPSLANASNIKSAEELEDEDREAQSAKLQELIRRGTPRDLAAAQELMKSLAGANPDAKPDYRAQALNELNKLESKVILLNELLDNVDRERGEQFVSGDAYDQVASILKSARPKIQKWINDAESDDSESLDTFLQINDQINTVVTRYEAFKKGDYTAAANPIPSELSTNTQQASLIDFDDGSTPAAGGTSNGGGIDDLSGLFASPAPPAMSTHQAFGNSSSSTPLPTHSPIPTTSYNTNTNNGNGFGGLRLGGGSESESGSSSPFQAGQSATPPAAIILPTSPAPGKSTFSASPPMPSMFGGMGVTMMSAQRPSSQLQQQQHQPSQQQSQPQSQKKDPFADLAGLF